MLELKQLSASIDRKIIVSDIDLSLSPGEIHLIMGPNGAGKSTLLKALIKQDPIETSGEILIDGNIISDLDTSQIARKGLFLAFQQPVEIPGVHMAEFLRTAHNLQHPDDKYDPWSFREIFDAIADKVGLDSDFGDRGLNNGFSGGEKKRSEILQLLILRPKYALLDEIDSGLDIDSLKNIFSLISDFAKNEKVGILLVSHNPNILKYLKPDLVLIMSKGKIVRRGDDKLIKEINENGYTF